MKKNILRILMICGLCAITACGRISNFSKSEMQSSDLTRLTDKSFNIQGESLPEIPNFSVTTANYPAISEISAERDFGLVVSNFDSDTIFNNGVSEQTYFRNHEILLTHLNTSWLPDSSASFYIRYYTNPNDPESLKYKLKIFTSCSNIINPPVTTSWVAQNKTNQILESGSREVQDINNRNTTQKKVLGNFYNTDYTTTYNLSINKETDQITSGNVVIQYGDIGNYYARFDITNITDSSMPFTLTNANGIYVGTFQKEDHFYIANLYQSPKKSEDPPVAKISIDLLNHNKMTVTPL